MAGPVNDAIDPLIKIELEQLEALAPIIGPLIPNFDLAFSGDVGYIYDVTEATEEDENATNRSADDDVVIPPSGTVTCNLETENLEMVNDSFDDDLSQLFLGDTSGHQDMDVIDYPLPPSRFPVLNEVETETILEDSHSKSTKKQTKYGVKIFRQWLQERGKDPNFEEYSQELLDSTLTQFYAEVRSADGCFYAKSTFVGIRASINRHLRSPPFNKTFSILSNDATFVKSNKMFLAMLKKVQRDGLDKTKHHSPISEGDLETLRKSDVISTSNPRSLQRKVWFDIMLSFGRRGRENQRSFKADTFGIKLDDRGRRYAEMVKSETTKNHKGGLDDKNESNKPRMYETGKSDCPVASLEMYLAKRNPSSDFFFQQPRLKVSGSEKEIWYTSRPLGERMLNTMMAEISKSAGLSQIYTNHCVRATTITILAQAGVAKTDIMKITGHKSEASLESYYRDSSEAQKRKFSAILQGQGNIEACDAVALTPTPQRVISPPLHFPSMSDMPMPNVRDVNLNNINNRLPASCTNFNVQNSTVQVFNYSVSHPHSSPQQ